MLTGERRYLALITVNIALLMPIPTVRVAVTATARPMFFRQLRSARRTSSRRSSTLCRQEDVV